MRQNEGVIDSHFDCGRIFGDFRGCYFYLPSNGLVSILTSETGKVTNAQKFEAHAFELFALKTLQLRALVFIHSFELFIYDPQFEKILYLRTGTFEGPVLGWHKNPKVQMSNFVMPDPILKVP